jgi:N-acetylated-alpha-linked acidic dipeptidase
MRLADAPVLPFEFGAFARAVRGYVTEVEKLASSKGGKVDLTQVKTKLALVEEDARRYERELARALPKASSAPRERLTRLNEILFRSERSLTLPGGLPGRSWYKHQIYAPGLYTGYSAKTLPGVREAIEAGRMREAQGQAASVAQVLAALSSQIRQAIQELRRL